MTPIAEAAAAVLLVARGLVLTAAALAGLVALVMWAVRVGRLAPFGAVARTVRALADPMLRPIEHAIRRFGRNPQEAPTWLFGLTVVLGVVVLSLVEWALRMAMVAESAVQGGPSAWGRVAVALAFDLVSFALLVRVIGSWLGAGRFSRWTRPAWLLTDWLVEPIRRRLPAFGPLDLSPLVAWFLLGILQAVVMTLL